MPVFGSHPKLAAITSTGTLPIPYPSVATFIGPEQANLSAAIALHLNPAILDAVALAVPSSNDDCGSGEDGDSASKTPPGQGGTPPGQAKKACRTNTTAGSTPTSMPPPSSAQSPPTQSPTYTRTLLPSTQSASTSPGPIASISAQDSSQTSSDSSATSHDGQLPEQETATTETGTTTSLPSISATLMTASSDSGIPAANLSTQSTLTLSSPESTSPSSTATTPAADSDVDLTPASTAGIALGVFVAASIVVAALLLLFRFLHKRRGNSANLDSPERNLTSSEGTPTRPLSSTWTLSWLGSLAISSEPDPEPKYGAERASTSTIRTTGPQLNGMREETGHNRQIGLQSGFQNAAANGTRIVHTSDESWAMPEVGEGPGEW